MFLFEELKGRGGLQARWMGAGVTAGQIPSWGPLLLGAVWREELPLCGAGAPHEGVGCLDPGLERRDQPEGGQAGRPSRLVEGWGVE